MEIHPNLNGVIWILAKVIIILFYKHNPSKSTISDIELNQ